MAFFVGELRECREKRRCLNNTEGQVGSLFSVQYGGLKKEIKQTCSHYSYSGFCMHYLYIYI